MLRFSLNQLVPYRSPSFSPSALARTIRRYYDYLNYWNQGFTALEQGAIIIIQHIVYDIGFRDPGSSYAEAFLGWALRLRGLESLGLETMPRGFPTQALLPIPAVYYPLPPSTALYCPLLPLTTFHCSLLLPCTCALHTARYLFFTARFCPVMPFTSLGCYLLPNTAFDYHFTYCPLPALYCFLLPFSAYFCPAISFTALCCFLLPFTTTQHCVLLPFAAHFCPLSALYLSFTSLCCLLLPFTGLFCLSLSFTIFNYPLQTARYLPSAALYYFLLPASYLLLPSTARKHTFKCNKYLNEPWPSLNRSWGIADYQSNYRSISDMKS